MSSIMDIYQIIKDLKSLAKEYQNSKMEGLVISIQGRFFDVKEEMETLRDKNKELEEKIRKMNENAFLESDLELVTDGYYVRKSEKSEGKKTRYCARCWNKEHLLIPYTQTINTHVLYCANCKNTIPR